MITCLSFLYFVLQVFLGMHTQNELMEELLEKKYTAQTRGLQELRGTGSCLLFPKTLLALIRIIHGLYASMVNSMILFL
jgi:hypothetical protein